MYKKKKLKKILTMCVPPIFPAIQKKLRLGRSQQRKTLLLGPNNNNFPLCCIEQANDCNFSDALRITRDGYKFPFYIRNNTSDVWVYKSLIDGMEYNFISSQEPKVIVDAGANIGLAAIFFAEKYPNATIISIEPEENNFNLLKQNTKNYSNVVALHAALWDKIEEIDLLETGLDNWGFMTAEESNHNNITTPKIQKKHTVKTVTIESLLKDYNISMIDILKIDIEGAEKEVFQNHSVWVNNVRSIIVELHERMKRGCEKEFRKMAKEFDEVAKYGEDFYLSKGGFIKMK